MKRTVLSRASASGLWLLLLAAAPAAQSLFRSIDGTNNHPLVPKMGAAGTQLLRISPSDYADGSSAPAGSGQMSPRAISNEVCAQSGSIPSAAQITDFVWQWGQFLDHDIDLTGAADPEEPLDIPVPLGDPFFDPGMTGTEVIPFSRSLYSPTADPREQVNEITTYIDASMVYGSDQTTANALRTFDGTGSLKTSAGDLLPFDPNDPGMFLAGDVRANEQVGLTSMHTLFVREHNYWCSVLGAVFPGFSGELIYQLARAVVGAEIQKITYEEFLPVLLGPSALDPYTGYDLYAHPGIANSFSTAAYRFGHSMLSPTLQRLDATLNDIPEGPLPLKDAFFNPDLLINEGGIEPLLRGLATQLPQEIDTKLVDDVRNFLFGAPGSDGFDLASLNLQRGRDHGLARYNQVRIDFGLAPAATFADISSDVATQTKLATVYATPDDVDVWVGGLAEDKVPGALVGELFVTILKDQFERLRDGDRFWYEIHFFGVIDLLIQNQTLAVIIRRNTPIGSEIQNNVFVQPGP